MRKLLALITTSVFLLGNVMADEAGLDSGMTMDEYYMTVLEEVDDYSNLNETDIFNQLKSSLDAGADIDLSTAFKEASNITIPDNFMYDLSDCGLTGELDASLVNMKFTNMITDLDAKLDVYDASNRIQGATGVYDSVYGDVAKEIQFETFEFSDDFDINKLTTESSANMNELYKDVYNSGSFNSIRNSIDISGVISSVNSGINIYTLDESSDIIADLQESMTNIAGESKKDYYANKLINGLSSSTTLELADMYEKISLYESMVSQTKALCSISDESLAEEALIGEISIKEALHQSVQDKGFTMEREQYEQLDYATRKEIWSKLKKFTD